MNYKYHLLKYKGPSTRFTCPSCGRKKCFTPYVDDDDQIIDPKYGKCDHDSSCGYCLYPPTETDWKQEYRPYTPKTSYTPNPKPSSTRIDTLPTSLVQSTIRTIPHSDFVTFLLSLFPQSVVYSLIDLYKLGLTKSGDVIFYQIDTLNRIRTGKIMKYNPISGHRIKDGTVKTPITWVHSILKQQGKLQSNWELNQCLFGEHLLSLYPEKTICLVEAEKTAVICSGLMPEYNWLATGGKTQLGDKLNILSSHQTVAFPDYDGISQWKEKCAANPKLNIFVSDYVDRYATSEQKEQGADIADIMIAQFQHKPQEAAIQISAEVRRYISAKYQIEVQKLIDELDLEIVSITKQG